MIYISCPLDWLNVPRLSIVWSDVKTIEINLRGNGMKSEVALWTSLLVTCDAQWRTVVKSLAYAIHMVIAVHMTKEFHWNSLFAMPFRNWFQAWCFTDIRPSHDWYKQSFRFAFMFLFVSHSLIHLPPPVFHELHLFANYLEFHFKICVLVISCSSRVRYRGSNMYKG